MPRKAKTVAKAATADCACLKKRVATACTVKIAIAVEDGPHSSQSAQCLPAGGHSQCQIQIRAEQTSQPMRIFDCILYNGEIEALRIRLENLWSAVDVFVIVECTHALDGQIPHLRSRWRLIKPYASKIRYIVAADACYHPLDRGETQLPLDTIHRGITDAADSDMVCISDVTTVPKVHVLLSIRQADATPIASCSTGSMRFDPDGRDDYHMPHVEYPCAFPKLALRMHTPTELRRGISNGYINARHVQDGSWRISRRHVVPADTQSPQQPMIICPYVHDVDREQTIRAFGLTETRGAHLPFFFWKDEQLIGPERAFEHCWNQFPDQDIVIVHTDMRPMPEDRDNNWYAALCTYAANLPNAAMIGCDLLYPLKSGRSKWYVQCAGGVFIDGKIAHIGGGVNLVENSATATAYEYDDSYSSVRKTQWVTFGGVYIRRETIDMIGGFDGRYEWAYVMDVDYCLEAQKRGLELFQVPVNLLHEESQTSKNYLALPEYQSKVGGNMRKFYEKWDAYLSVHAQGTATNFAA